MGSKHQNILLVDRVPEAIEGLINTFSESSLADVQVATAHSVDFALELLHENEFSLIIAGVNDALNLDAIAPLTGQQSPKPSIVILPKDSSSDIIKALRLGAADVFIRDSECFANGKFSRSVAEQLYKASLVEVNAHYQAELEKSLTELKKDLQAARHIQQKILPDKTFVCENLMSRHLLIPSLYLSGDFVDVIPISEEYTLFFLADVSGHGASSAMVTVLLKNLANRLRRNYQRGSSFDVLSPTQTLKRLNNEILETGFGKHLSIFLGLYNHFEQTLTYGVGGHHPMPILSYKDDVRFLEGRGMPVGLFPEPVFEEIVLNLDGQFQLTLFSDGILEVLTGDSMAEKEQKLLEAVSGSHDISPEQIKDALIPEFTGDAPDDIAIMTINRL